MGTIEKFPSLPNYDNLATRLDQVAIAIQAGLDVTPVVHHHRGHVQKGLPTTDLDTVQRMLQHYPAISWGVNLGSLIAVRFNYTAARELIGILGNDEPSDWADTLAFTDQGEATLLFSGNGSPPRVFPRPIAKAITVNSRNMLILPGSATPLGSKRRWIEPVRLVAKAPGWIYAPTSDESVYLRKIACIA